MVGNGHHNICKERALHSSTLYHSSPELAAKRNKNENKNMGRTEKASSWRAREKMGRSSHEKLVLFLLVLVFACIEIVSSFIVPTTMSRAGCHRHHLQNPTLLKSEILSTQEDESPSNPDIKPWMKCINEIANKDGALNEVVSKLANVSLEQANHLISIGAVWAKMDVLTEQEIIDQYYDESASASAKISYSDLDKGWHSDRSLKSPKGEGEEDVDVFIARMESRRYNRVLGPSTITQGTDLRIYPFPRRFPSCSELDESRLLYEDTTFVIVDKPPLLPTQPDASNYFENCPGCTGLNLGPFTNLAGETIERPLLCHRVDSVVGGCVVMSKDANGQAVFSRFQRDRKVKKVYLAVTKKPVPLGMHVHWIWGETNKRGGSGGPPCVLVSHEVPVNRKKAKSWMRCILEVVKSEPIEISKDSGYDPGTEAHYQNTIRLVTGRKHQVRAQLSSLGCPIIRDTLYEPIGGMTLDMLNEGDEGAIGVMMAIEDCRVPQEPIGLQAHAILFGGIRAKAGAPWWGTGVIQEEE